MVIGAPFESYSFGRSNHVTNAEHHFLSSDTSPIIERSKASVTANMLILLFLLLALAAGTRLPPARRVSLQICANDTGHVLFGGRLHMIPVSELVGVSGHVPVQHELGWKFSSSNSEALSTKWCFLQDFGRRIDAIVWPQIQLMNYTVSSLNSLLLEYQGDMDATHIEITTKPHDDGMDANKSHRSKHCTSKITSAHVY